MYLLFEAIKVENRLLCNLEYHQWRVDRSMKALFKNSPPISLSKISIPKSVDPHLIYKCRVTYGEKIEEVKFIPYEKRQIKSLKLVKSDEIEYGFKYNNRKKLEELKQYQGSADEIIIIKNGLVTDTSFTNIAFYDGIKWHTPSAPLLKGTKRQKLLDDGLLEAKEIRETDIPDFQYACPINAFFDLAPENYLLTKDIY
ncbi:MAG: aminotransferase class IV [Bacteroidales bacterium]|nr:aminotransferase class IV [Bacteroidales bacterium]